MTKINLTTLHQFGHQFGYAKQISAFGNHTLVRVVTVYLECIKWVGSHQRLPGINDVVKCIHLCLEWH